MFLPFEGGLLAVTQGCVTSASQSSALRWGVYCGNPVSRRSGRLRMIKSALSASKRPRTPSQPARSGETSMFSPQMI